MSLPAREVRRTEPSPVVLRTQRTPSHLVSNAQSVSGTGSGPGTASIGAIDGGDQRAPEGFGTMAR